MSRTIHAFLWIALAGLLTGCEAKIYRAETVVESDGRIRRAIYQPADETPPAAQEAAWAESTFAPRVRHQEWDASIRSLPKAIQDEDRPYFAAWGEFATGAELPRTFHKAAPEGYPDGTLQLDYQREDLVLVVEHRWRETLTDIVTLDDMHHARRELADELLPMFEKTINRGLGDEYDTSALSDWLQSTARPMAFELTDAFFEVGARGQLSSPDGLERAFEPVLTRHGIAICDESGTLLEGDALGAALGRSLHLVLMETLRRRDGQPVRPAVADEIVQWLGLQQVPEGFEKSQRYEEAAKAVMAETYGSEEGMTRAIKPLGLRIMGLYRGELAAPARQFDYSLEMPGTIVETSGEIVSENTTRFRFVDAQAYPFGFAMQCRSLVEEQAREQQVVGRRVLTDRAKLLRYVELVRERPELLTAMQLCQAEGSLEPLRRQRNQVPSGQTDQLRLFDALLKLLDSKG